MLTRDEVKKLRTDLEQFCKDNNIEFDSKISTKNLLIKCRKEGFEPEGIDIEGFLNPEHKKEEPQKEETQKEETQKEFSPELQETAKILKEALPIMTKQDEPEKKSGSWIWVLVGLIATIAVIMIIKIKNSNNG